MDELKNKLNYKLSICMMVKDEEENLPRCLNSIQPILDRIDVELIIVDTGSSDKTVEIAKQITDKVYFHSWKHNFSEIRNITISYAKGDWVFILDADEELVDSDKMLKLLDSNFLGEYNTVQVLYRNYLFKSSDRVIIQPSNRMFRNDGTFYYKGAVHNQPVYKEPILAVDINFNHYGYFNDDSELMEKKFKRTSTLLIGELEKDPENIYYHFQLARSFAMHRNFGKALELIRRAFTLIETRKEEPVKYQHIFVNYAYIAKAAHEPHEVITVCKQGILLFPKQIDLFYLLGTANLMIKDKKEAIYAFETYLELFQIGEDLPVFKDFAMEVNYYDNESRESSLLNLSKLYFAEGNYEKAIDYLEQLDDNNQELEILAVSFIKMNKYKQLVERYITINNVERQKEMANAIEIEYKSLESNEKKELTLHFIKSNDIYGSLHIIRTIDNVENLKAAAKSFFAEHGIEDLPIYYSDIFIKLSEYGLPFINEWKKIKSSKVKYIVKYMCEQSDEIEQIMLNYLLAVKVRASDLHSNRVYIAIANVMLLLERENAKKENRLINQELVELFSLYINAGIHYITSLYQIERLRIFYKTLDDSEQQFFSIMYLVQDSLKRENVKLALQYYKKAALIYPFMAEYMDLTIYKLHIRLADYYIEKGKYDDAIEMYENALLKLEIESKQIEIINAIQMIEERYMEKLDLHKEKNLH
ncbi:glycosyltransferase [bacterium LRH843]|nr:glycosyltransferase [bacterium LRH843]